MAFTITSQTNLYNPNLDGLTKTELVRRGLASGGFQEDAANKAFGGPQYVLVGQTTAAETGAFTLNLATATRSVPNPLGSPSLNDPITLGPLVGALTAGVGRRFRFKVTQVIAGVRTVFEKHASTTGAATPTVTNAAATVRLGNANNAGDDVVLAAAASSLTVSVTSGAAVTCVWTVEVFADDPA